MPPIQLPNATIFKLSKLLLVCNYFSQLLFMKINTLALTVFTLLLLINASSFASEPPQFSGILASHNVVRAKYQQQPLSWSESLAKYAQQWVEHLASTQNCQMIHRPNYGGARFQQIHGENLFWASPEELSNGVKKLQPLTPKEIVKAWAEEENFYDYQSNKCKEGRIVVTSPKWCGTNHNKSAAQKQFARTNHNSGPVIIILGEITLVNGLIRPLGN